MVAVDVGASQQFTFRALDGFGNEISDVPGLWSVPTEAGAIDSNGVLTASTVAGLFLQGIRVEVVTGEDRASDESDLAVQSGPLSTIDLTPSLIDMKKGGQQQFEARGVDEFGNEVPSTAIRWRASGGSVTQNGLFTATKFGPFVVTAGNLVVIGKATGDVITTPIMWWPGEGAANDIVGDFGGTLVHGAAFSPGLVGQAFSFDGIDDWVSIPFAATANEFTVEAWVSFDQTETGWGAIYANDLDGGLFLLDQQIVWWQPGNGVTLQGESIVPIREWHHVAVTCDGVRFLAYLDSEVDGTGSLPDLSLPLGARLGIGGHGDVDFFKGLIDELKVYDRVLTAAEIRTSFKANQPVSTGS